MVCVCVCVSCVCVCVSGASAVAGEAKDAVDDNQVTIGCRGHRGGRIGCRGHRGGRIGCGGRRIGCGGHKIGCGGHRRLTDRVWRSQGKEHDWNPRTCISIPGSVQ
eukprot:1252484-Rhodomonas_salina.1